MIGAEHPDNTRLTRQDWRSRRSKTFARPAWSNARWSEAQRGIRRPQDVCAFSDCESEIGRHTGLELERGVINLNHRVVSHDVLHVLGVETNLRDPASESVGEVSINCEADAVA